MQNQSYVLSLGVYTFSTCIQWEALILSWGDPHREAKAADVVVKLNAKAVKKKKKKKSVKLCLAHKLMCMYMLTYKPNNVLIIHRNIY